MTFYTYLWLREDGSPYYVGKGQGDRAFKKRRHYWHPPTDVARIILQEWPSETLAFVGEKMLIAYYGRIDNGTGCLRNLTDGGEGPSGLHHTDVTRRRLSDKHRGKILSEDTRRKMSEAHRGKIASAVSRQRNSESNRGKSLSEEHRRKIAKALLGQKHTPERCHNISVARRARRGQQ